MSMDIRALAYLVAETTDVAAWKNYAEQVVGAMTEPTAEGGLLVKIDERQQRMVIRPGSANRLQASGWETLDKKAFEEAKAVLNKHGVAFAEGSQADCKLRWVTEMITFQDPAGNTHAGGSDVHKLIKHRSNRRGKKQIKQETKQKRSIICRSLPDQNTYWKNE